MVKITVLRNFAQIFAHESVDQPNGTKETAPIIKNTKSERTTIQKKSNKPKKTIGKNLAKKRAGDKQKPSTTVEQFQQPSHRNNNTVNRKKSAALDPNPRESSVAYDYVKPLLKSPWDFMDTDRLDIMMRKLRRCEILDSTDISYIVKFLLAAAQVNSQQVKAHFKMLRVRGLLTQEVIESVREIQTKLKGIVDPIEIRMIRRERRKYLRSVKREEKAREVKEDNETKEENEAKEENESKEDNEVKETNAIFYNASAHKVTDEQASIDASASENNEASIDVQNFIETRFGMRFAENPAVYYSGVLVISEVSESTEAVIPNTMNSVAESGSI